MNLNSFFDKLQQHLEDHIPLLEQIIEENPVEGIIIGVLFTLGGILIFYISLINALIINRLSKSNPELFIKFIKLILPSFLHNYIEIYIPKYLKLLYKLSSINISLFNFIIFLIVLFVFIVLLIYYNNMEYYSIYYLEALSKYKK